MHEELSKRLRQLREQNPHASFQSLWDRCCRENPELIPAEEDSPRNVPGKGSFHQDMSKTPNLADANVNMASRAGRDMSFAEHVAFYEQMIRLLDVEPVLRVQGGFFVPLSFHE